MYVKLYVDMLLVRW